MHCDTEPMDATTPDDHGITDTNDPTIRVLWERHGATVSLTLVHADLPPVRPWVLPA